MSPARPQFVSSGFFVLRTPLFPYDDLQALCDGLEVPATPSEPAALLHQSLARDRGTLRDRLRSAYRRPELRDAIFLASPDVEEALGAWLEGADGERFAKLELALFRYFARACARPTPFGLFAGCSVGTFGKQTDLTLPCRSEYKRHSRLDGDYLHALAEGLTREPAFRDDLVYQANTSMYHAAGRLRYVQARIGQKGSRRSPTTSWPSSRPSILKMQLTGHWTVRPLRDR